MENGAENFKCPDQIGVEDFINAGFILFMVLTVFCLVFYENEVLSLTLFSLKHFFMIREYFVRCSQSCNWLI
jgi:hypothetical protein